MRDFDKGGLWVGGIEVLWGFFLLMRWRRWSLRLYLNGSCLGLQLQVAVMIDV